MVLFLMYYSILHYDTDQALKVPDIRQHLRDNFFGEESVIQSLLFYKIEIGSKDPVNQELFQQMVSAHGGKCIFSSIGFYKIISKGRDGSICLRVTPFPRVSLALW